jgi:ribosomal-protein-alanine N-acetyltransferase
VIVRPLRIDDLCQVARIEQQAMPAPWSEEQLQAEIEAGNSIARVVEYDDHLCGYAFFRTCLPECELVHLVVAPEWQRLGAALVLLEQALADFSGQGYATCFLEVRESNDAARRLYAKAGFLQTGTRKYYYSQPVEDALLMSRDLLDSK